MKTAPKKYLGQHFLRDTGVLGKIVEHINPTKKDLILEIGAGNGSLSGLLAPRCGRLLAIEIDMDCIPSLEGTLSGIPGAQAIFGDLLRIDLQALTRVHLDSNQNLRAVGNLPYNAATAIIERLLRSQLTFVDLNFLVQLEVGQRMAALPGTRQYGFFSVFCQHFCNVRMGFKVGPGAFTPPPKVVSAMISMTPRSRSQAPVSEEVFLFLTKAAFGHRRKKLSNSLKLHPDIGPAADRLLESAGIDGDRRPEQLTVAEYESLARIYHNLMKNNAL